MVKFMMRSGFLVFLLLVLPMHLSFEGSRSNAALGGIIYDSPGLTLGENNQASTLSTSLLTAGSGVNPEPILLHYLIRLIGNDWLGADWIYLGLFPYRYTQLDNHGEQVTSSNPVSSNQVPLWNSARFWVNPGPALLKARDVVWVWGYMPDTYNIYADTIQVNPPSRVAAPIDVSASGYIRAVTGETITIQDPTGIDYTITVDAYTTYSFPPNVGLPRPQQGSWMDISWLTGADGLLGRYDGFHGDYRGLLRLDFRKP
jgi:hypothetical protein